jgi:hypothetical protein
MDLSGLIFGIAAYLACVGCLVVLPVYIVVRGILDKRRDRQELHRRVHDAIEKITADGKIEGPKGTYKPKRAHGSLTDGSTSAPRHSGYYHHPWAK